MQLNGLGTESIMDRLVIEVLPNQLPHEVDDEAYPGEQRHILLLRLPRALDWSKHVYVRQ